MNLQNYPDMLSGNTNIRFENLINFFKPIIDELNQLNIKFSIAGGAIRDYLTNNKISDIDIFFYDEEALEIVLEYLANNNGIVILNNDLVVKIEYNNHVLDIIKRIYPGNPKNILNSFDFTVCQFLLTSNFEFIYNSNSFIDLSKKQLMLSNIEYPESTMLRVRKYMLKGYNICHEEINKVIFSIRNKGLEPDDKLYTDVITGPLENIHYMNSNHYTFYVYEESEPSYLFEINNITNYGFLEPIEDINNQLNDYKFYGID